MRNLTPAMQTAITARVIQPAIFAQLTFKSETVYVWTGVGAISYTGQTWRGIGDLASIGTITENTTVEASATSVSLNGIDPTLYADCMNDIVTGQPASIWLACMNGSAVLGTIMLFKGMIDIPTVSEDTEDISIALALESKLTNLQRANRKLWTSAEQQRLYPTDTGFTFVPLLQDMANVWG